MTLYLVRRHLGFSVDEWRALPWWQAELYLRGLIQEHQPADSGYQPLTDDGDDYRPTEREDDLTSLSNRGFNIVSVPVSTEGGSS